MDSFCLACGPGTLAVSKCLLKIMFLMSGGGGLPAPHAMQSVPHLLSLILQLWVSPVLNEETEVWGGYMTR